MKKANQETSDNYDMYLKAHSQAWGNFWQLKAL